MTRWQAAWRRAAALSCLDWLAFGSLALLATGCPETTKTCAGEESVVLKMNGSCAPGQQTFEVRRTGCTLAIIPGTPGTPGTPGAPGASGGQDAGTAQPLGIPSAGAVGESGSPVRQGGWVIWGCLSGDEPCPGQFRFCSTKREAFQLDMSCLDGAGALACEAVLTE